MRDSRFELVPGEFLKQPDLAIYGLSILFVGMFLFLPFFHLLHPSPWHRWMGTIYCFGVLLATVVDTPDLALEASALCKFTFCGGGILPAQRYGRARCPCHKKLYFCKTDMLPLAWTVLQQVSFVLRRGVP